MHKLADPQLLSACLRGEDIAQKSVRYLGRLLYALRTGLATAFKPALCANT